jgi:hypothetical protein
VPCTGGDVTISHRHLLSVESKLLQLLHPLLDE